MSSLLSLCISFTDDKYQTLFCSSQRVPYGLVVRIRRSHRRGPGSIPGVGTAFLFVFHSHTETFFSFASPTKQMTIFERYLPNCRHPRDESAAATLFRKKARLLLETVATRVLDPLRMKFWLSSGTCLGQWNFVFPESADVSCIVCNFLEVFFGPALRTTQPSEYCMCCPL